MPKMQMHPEARARSLKEAAGALSARMAENASPRRRALEKMGGRGFVCSLPREKRALALASVLLEEPPKHRMSQRCFMVAFRCALDEGNIASAKEHFHQFTGEPEKKEAHKLVLAKVETLRKQGREAVADMHEVIFGLSADAAMRFSQRMEALLSEAESQLDFDDRSAHALFNRIMDQEELAGLEWCSLRAAAGLAVLHLRQRNLGNALEVTETRLLREGGIPGIAKCKLIPEIQEMVGRTSEPALARFAQDLESRGLLPLMQEAVLGLASEEVLGDLEQCRKVFGLLAIFGPRKDAEELGAYLALRELELADAEPWRMRAHYLAAARTAAKVELVDELEEALDKYLALVLEEAEGNPELSWDAALVAKEFGRTGLARELAERAATLYVREGMVAQAEKAAADIGLEELRAQASEIRRRIRG